MKNILKLLTISLVILLSGCAGSPQASLSEQLSDNFLFTSASTVSSSETRCMTMTKAFAFKSGSVTFNIPAGKYVGSKKNSTGYFYYAPSLITSSSWFAGSALGIYINNQFNQANLFTTNPNGFDDRPIRASVLPHTIFSYIKKC